MQADPSIASTFNEHSREVYAWAYRLLGRHHDALDVAQDVFVRWMRQSATGAPRHPRAWLRQVTLHRSIDLCRTRQNQLPASSDSQPIEAASTGEPARVLDQAALRQDLTSALVELSELQRNVLVAKVYDEMTFAEIAEEQGISVSTAKTHYLRAVRAARDRLQARWGDEVQP